MSNTKERILPGPERLRAYDLAQQLGLAVDQVVRDCRVRKHLEIQLVRAADSTLLNIAEGAGNYSPGRKRFHYEIAHGSAAECIAALTRILNQRHCSHAEDARRKANMLCVMLARLIARQKT
jgi:four helix bundle protein